MLLLNILSVSTWMPDTKDLKCQLSSREWLRDNSRWQVPSIFMVQTAISKNILIISAPRIPADIYRAWLTLVLKTMKRMQAIIQLVIYWMRLICVWKIWRFLITLNLNWWRIWVWVAWKYISLATTYSLSLSCRNNLIPKQSIRWTG